MWVEVVAECLGVQHLLLRRSRGPWFNFDSAREREGVGGVGRGGIQRQTDKQTDRQTDRDWLTGL